VSTYLARLVDRGLGVPGGAVSPRLAPEFPLGQAAGPQERETGPGLLPDAFVPGLPPPRTLVPRPSDVPAAAATAATVRTGPSPARQGSERGSGASGGEPSVPSVPEPTPPRRPRTGEPVSTEPSPAFTGRDPAVRMSPADVAVAAPRRIDPAREESVATQEDGPIAKAVPRAKPARDQLTAAVAGRAAAAPEPAPQIEVRIGRVEVRRPHEAEPVPWPSVAPQPVSAPGFERLAAARRYVDRRWS
jgi:hypothetical protein